MRSSAGMARLRRSLAWHCSISVQGYRNPAPAALKVLTVAPSLRIVHGSRSANLRRIVHKPAEAVMPASSASAGELGAAAASSPVCKPTAAGEGSLLREVQMENIHPLRLRILLEIERIGSISAAAERCSIAQPTASMHVRTLETAIGQRLVTRTGRGSSLTPAGKIVASHAARVLATLDSMRRALDALDARSGGELTIAASLMPSVALIPPILCRFLDRYPDVSVTLRTVPSETAVREIARSAADVGIAGEVATANPIISRQILMDELVGIAPVGLFNSGDAEVTRGELARNSILLGAEGSSTRIVTERYLARADFRPGRVWAFSSYEAIKRAVADGLGVSFISRLLVREEIGRGELAAFGVSGVEPMLRPIHAVQSSVTELTAPGAAFMALLIDANWSSVEQGQPMLTSGGATPRQNNARV